jgi:CheY-like chemotaxis protein
MKNKLNILIVDDSEVIQDVIKLLLMSLGHTGVIVNNGEEALRCLDQRKFDLILMDVTMPVMDGLTALKLLRTKEQKQAQNNYRTPVILITGNDLPSDVERYNEAGADGFLSKPIDFQLLAQAIQRVI